MHAPPGEAVYIFNINTATPSIHRRWKLQIFHVLYILNREQISMTTSILMYCHQCADNKCTRSPQPSYTQHLFLHFLLLCFIYGTDYNTGLIILFKLIFSLFKQCMHNSIVPPTLNNLYPNYWVHILNLYNLYEDNTCYSCTNRLY
jgi:hypothetical protein